MSSPPPAILPGEWLGLLGGGQLGRMFTQSAHRLGYKVCVLDPDTSSPTGAIAERHLQAASLDDAALGELARQARATTTEFENVPAAALNHLAQHGPVSPDAAAVRIAQDRAIEKRFVHARGIPVAPHAVIERTENFATLDATLFPGILKTARLGYDGKGQVTVASAAEARAAWERLGAVPCVLEQRLPLQQEVSCIVARGRDGAVASFPIVENTHRDGILAVSVAPARIAPQLAEEARSLAVRIAEAMQYVGVLCIEFFVLADGRLVVNEMAPRPHNSGHYTIDACITSQFEQQVRILAGLPLGDTTQLAHAVMLNLLGDLWFDAAGTLREPAWAEVLRDPCAKLHLYGKHEPRRGRKMGHLTLLAPNHAQAIAAANRAAARLQLPAVS